MTKEEIGKILKEARLNAGMTQAQVAKLLGRRQQIIGHWETGYSQPDANTFFVLCDIYKISIDDAFCGGSRIKVNASELKLLQKYRELDEHGKQLIDMVLDHEHKRCTADPLADLNSRLDAARDEYFASQTEALKSKAE